VAKLRIQLDVPTPGSTAVSNVLGLVGVVVLPVSLGGLVGNWWVTGLVASVLLLAIAAVANYNGTGAEDDSAPATARAEPDVFGPTGDEWPVVPAGPAQGVRAG
jgi:hypothetical protein